MQFVDTRYERDGDWISATVDGYPTTFPVDPDNRYYAAMVAAGVTPAAYSPPAVTVLDIKAEAQRRIILRVGANDLQGATIKQLNMIARGVELTNMRVLGAELTEAENAESAALQSAFDAIKAIRAASNNLELTLPADYAGDEYWP